MYKVSVHILESFMKKCVWNIDNYIYKNVFVIGDYTQAIQSEKNPETSDSEMQ